MAEQFTRSFAWCLQIAVWSNRLLDGSFPEDRDEVRGLPYLALITDLRDTDGFEGERLLGMIEFSLGATPRENRWLMRFFPGDESLSRSLDEGDMVWNRRYQGPTRKSAHRINDALREGEIRQPRDTARAALDALIKHTSELTTATIAAALAKTGPLYLPVLESASKAWVTRPKSAR